MKSIPLKLVCFLIITTQVLSGCSNEQVVTSSKDVTTANNSSKEKLQGDEWSTTVDSYSTTRIKMMCQEDQMTIYQKIRPYLESKGIHLSEIEFERSVVLTYEGSRVIASDGNKSVEFNFKDNEVIISGGEVNSMENEWESITPLSVNWNLLSDFSSRLNVTKLLYK